MARSASSTAVCTCGFKVPEPEQPEQPQESPQQAEEEAGTPHHEVLPDNEMEINESIYGSRN